MGSLPGGKRQRNVGALAVVALTLLVIIFTFKHGRSWAGNGAPVLHVTPLSHLDPGWKLTNDETYYALAVPIFKQTLLELLLDRRRTFVMEPILYLARFVLTSGQSPISTQTGGFSSPLEMYTSAVFYALSVRAKSLEPGIKHSTADVSTGAGQTHDTSKLWAFQNIPTIHLQEIATVLHDHEGRTTSSTRVTERVKATAALLSESEALIPVALLFTIGAPLLPSALPAPEDISSNAVRSFLREYDSELKRLKVLSRRGGTHGSRIWEEKSLTALLGAAESICLGSEAVNDGAADDKNGKTKSKNSSRKNICQFSCKSILKDVGAPLMSPEGNETSAQNGLNNHLASIINFDNCKLPTYSQVITYLSQTTKQLEIVGSGWVSHDESLPSFTDILDSSTLGRSSIRSLLRQTPPSIAWQIDSFGHSGGLFHIFSLS